MKSSDEQKSNSVPAGAGPIDPVQSPPDAWTAESLVTAWQTVFEGIEAHILDRIAMNDPANPERYLRIIRDHVEDVNNYSQQLVNSRWRDYRSQREQVERLQASNDELLESLKKAHGLIDRVSGGGAWKNSYLREQADAIRATISKAEA